MVDACYNNSSNNSSSNRIIAITKVLVILCSSINSIIVLLTLALAGEPPTCILHEGIHPVTRAIEVTHAAYKAEF